MYTYESTRLVCRSQRSSPTIADNSYIDVFRTSPDRSMNGRPASRGVSDARQQSCGVGELQQSNECLTSLQCLFWSGHPYKAKESPRSPWCFVFALAYLAYIYIYIYTASMKQSGASFDGAARWFDNQAHEQAWLAHAPGTSYTSARSQSTKSSRQEQTPETARQQQEASRLEFKGRSRSHSSETRLNANSSITCARVRQAAVICGGYAAISIRKMASHTRRPPTKSYTTPDQDS